MAHSRYVDLCPVGGFLHVCALICDPLCQDERPNWYFCTCFLHITWYMFFSHMILFSQHSIHLLVGQPSFRTHCGPRVKKFWKAFVFVVSKKDFNPFYTYNVMETPPQWQQFEPSGPSTKLFLIFVLQLPILLDVENRGGFFSLQTHQLLKLGETLGHHAMTYFKSV